MMKVTGCCNCCDRFLELDELVRVSRKHQGWICRECDKKEANSE